MRKTLQWAVISGFLTALSAHGAVIELNCEMKPDVGSSINNLVKALPPEQAARIKEEFDKRTTYQAVYTLDTEKKSLRLRWSDPNKGGYQWRTVKNLQKRTLPDDIIAYAYEREDTGNDDQIESAREMILIAPEVKTVIQATYGITHDGKEAGMIIRGACK